MFKDIGFLDHDDWYVIKKIDKYNSIIELTSKAPTEWDSYRSVDGGAYRHDH